jgi:hypothetical protein
MIEAKVIKKSDKQEKPKLPVIGKKFMVEGVEYEVIYVNDGKHRFSAQPCQGQY